MTERKKPGPKPLPIEDRFWAKVLKTENCWEWTASRLPRGYGLIKRNRSDPKGRNAYAHRVSWEIHYGEVPDGKCVLHECDNPGCVNPDHLFIGTDKDNMRDCAQKGRLGGCSLMNWKGERSPVAKLTNYAVRDIRKSRKSLSVLALKYGVTKGTIWKVKTGLTWTTME